MKQSTKVIFLFILAGVWIEFNETPIIPIGFILILLWIRPISFKRYKFLILAMILGFIGTGLSFKIFQETTFQSETGRAHHFSKYLLNVSIGTNNISQFLKRDRIVLYKDNFYKKEQELLDKYLRSFVESYNNKNNSPFLGMSETREIADMYYFGYLKEMKPNMKLSDLVFVYKVKFAENFSWKTIHFRITFVQGELKVLNIELQDEEVEYEIKISKINTHKESI